MHAVDNQIKLMHSQVYTNGDMFQVFLSPSGCHHHHVKDIMVGTNLSCLQRPHQMRLMDLIAECFGFELNLPLHFTCNKEKKTIVPSQTLPAQSVFFVLQHYSTGKDEASLFSMTLVAGQRQGQNFVFLTALIP